MGFEGCRTDFATFLSGLWTSESTKILHSCSRNFEKACASRLSKNILSWMELKDTEVESNLMLKSKFGVCFIRWAWNWDRVSFFKQKGHVFILENNSIRSSNLKQNLLTTLVGWSASSCSSTSSGCCAASGRNINWSVNYLKQSNWTWLDCSFCKAIEGTKISFLLFTSWLLARVQWRFSLKSSSLLDSLLSCGLNEP